MSKSKKLEQLGYKKEEIASLTPGDEQEVDKALGLVEAAMESPVVQKPQDLSMPGCDTPPDIDFNMTSPLWTEKILSYLDKDRETENGQPRVDGLRRLARMVFGEFSTQTDVIDCPSANNLFRAVVKCRIIVHHKNMFADGAADVYSGNTDPQFAEYAVATAETRAEGRALKKLLCLTRVLVAEEVGKPSPSEPRIDDERVGSSVVNGLMLMGKRLGVNLIKVAGLIGIKVNDLKEMSKKEALTLTDKLNKYIRNEEKVTEDIKG